MVRFSNIKSNTPATKRGQDRIGRSHTLPPTKAKRSPSTFAPPALARAGPAQRAPPLAAQATTN